MITGINIKRQKYIAHLIPLLFIYKWVSMFRSFEYWEGFFGKLVGIHIIILVLNCVLLLRLFKTKTEI
jgi:hypothetical protein